MQRIAYITGAFPQWSETFISREVALLRAAGVPLEVATVRPGAGQLPAGCPAPFVLQPAAGPTMRKAPGPSVPLPGIVRRMASLHKHADVLQRLIDWCRARRVGHLHGAFLDLPGLLAAAAGRELDLPWSLSFHANDALLEKYDTRFLTAGATAIVGCNRCVYDRFRARHPELAGKLHLVPHGLDLDAWPRRPGSWQPGQPVRLLFVGRLVPKKRPALAVQALDHLSIEANLTIIGDGPLAADLAHERVTLKGVQTPAEVRAAMAHADLLLMTSQDLPNGDAEGLPNVILEAMASGLPVVATPAGSIDEVLDESTGFPCSDHQPASIARTLEAAIADPADTEQRCQAARRIVVARYDAHDLIQQRLACLGWAGP